MIIRHGNGILESKGKKKTLWGFDFNLNGKRFRRIGWLSKGEAELALTDSRDAGEPLCENRVPSFEGLKFGSVGALAELVVCADLLQQGYDVFRSVSSNAACDIIAANREGELCRIEVKSAVTARGRVTYKRHGFDSNKHDVLALVFLREQQIDYSVSLEQWFRLRKEPKSIAS